MFKEKNLQFAFKVAGSYLLLSAFWIVFSDRILLFFFTDLHTVAQFQTLKGLSFVGLTALLLYFYVKKLGKDLVSQSKFFESIFDQANIALLAIDNQGNIKKTNASALMLFKTDSMSGHSILDYLPGGQHREFFNTLQNMFGKSVVFERETQLLKSSQSNFNAKMSLYSELGGEYILVIITPIAADTHYKAFADIMLQIIQGIPSDANERQIYEQVLHELCNSLNWDIGEIWVKDPASEMLILSAQWYDLTQADSMRFVRDSSKLQIEPGMGLVGATYLDKTARWFNHLGENPSFIRREQAKLAQLNIGVALPLIIDEEVVAVLLMLRKSPVESDRTLLQFLVGVVSELANKIKRNRDFIMKRELESSLLFMMESANIALWEYDCATRTQNRFYSFVDENGHASLRSVKLSENEAQQFIHPDDRKRFNLAIDQAIATGKTFSLEYRNIIGGRMVWMWARGQVTMQQGKPKTISGIRLDITDRKMMEKDLESSEKKYRNLFNDNPLPLAIYSLADYTLHEANAAAISFYGYSPDEVRGVKLTDLAADLNLDEIKERQSKVHEHGFVSWESRHRLKSGEFREVLIAARKIEYQGSKDTAIATILDITEKKRAERNLMASTIKGEESERSRIAKELHDGLGQLLAAANLNLNGLKSELTKSNLKAQEHFDQAQKALNQAIVETRTISHNLMPKTIEDFGLSVSIESLANMIRKAHPTLEIQFYNNLDKELKFDSMLEVNLYRIAQECFNNTIKHAEAKKVELQLIAHEKELIFTFSDNGKGFEFDPKSSSFLGIGLLNIQKRVNSLNGELMLESRPNKGTQYTITIPL